MLSSNCFSVACKSADACKTQGANPSRYNPKISYVRDFKTNALLGKRIHMLIICKQMKTILSVSIKQGFKSPTHQRARDFSVDKSWIVRLELKSQCGELLLESTIIRKLL